MQEPQAVVKVTSKTSSILCERAARIAVVMCFTLSDIESAIPSTLHQFLLLKALTRYDKSRSLLHRCNLHRWLIRKSLHSHPHGSASPNFVSPPPNRLGSWIAEDDLDEVFHGVVSVGGDPPPQTTAAAAAGAGGGDSRCEEERASVEFLEKILREETEHDEDSNPTSHTDNPNSQNGMANGGADSTEHVLSTSYKCQVIIDVAELYFMRGKIRRAHELFSKCGEMLGSQSARELSSAGDNGDGLPDPSISDASHSGVLSEGPPVPQDRLAGFIVACKMLLRTSADANGVETTTRPVAAGNYPEPSFVGVSSLTQWAIIACEQSRWAARRHGSKVVSQSALANGDSGCSDFSSGKDNLDASVSGRTSTDMMGRTSVEDSSAHDGSSRGKKRKYFSEEANGDVMQSEGQIEREDSLGSETVKQVKESGHRETKLGKMQVDEPFSNGGEGRSHERRDEVDWDSQTGNDAKTGVPSLLGLPSQMGVDTETNDPTAAAFGGSTAGHGPDVDLLVGLKGDPADETVTKLISDMKYSSTTVQERRLLHVFVEGIFRGHLSEAYCLAVEKDSLLSRPVRSKLAACNVVRAVLEGGPVETFLRMRGYFESSEDSVEFLMQLLLAIKAMQELHRLSLRRLPRSASDCRRTARPVKLVFAPQSQSGEGGLSEADVSAFTRRIHLLALYVCSIIDKPWCWGSALKLGLVGQRDLPRFLGQLPHKNTLKDVEGSGIFLKADSQPESVQASFVRKGDDTEIIAEREILLSFVQVESIAEIEALVGKVRKMTEKVRAKAKKAVASGQRRHTCEHIQSPVQSDLVKLAGSHSQIASSSWLAKGKSPTCLKCHSRTTAPGPDLGDQCSALEADVAATLRRRAFNALEVMNDRLVAKRLYELALALQPRDCDSAMMLWLLERSAESDGQVLAQGARTLPGESEGDVFPSVGLLDFVILHLIEKELWGTLCELCKWAASLMLKDPVTRDGEQSKNAEKEALMSPSRVGENPAPRNRLKPLLQMLNMARTVVDLMPLCFSLQTAVSRNHFNEDVARLGSTLSQLFEEFLCYLVGIDSEGHIRGSDDAAQWRSTQVGLAAPSHPNSAAVSLISRVTNPRVLMALASLTAGWLQRCHVVQLTPWPLAVERYGVLAGVTAGASLPPPVGSLPYPAAVLRPVPPKVSPEFGRELFGVLLEGIVGLPGVVEGDKEKGHRWLQGLADLAFEGEAYVKALRLYLQV